MLYVLRHSKFSGRLMEEKKAPIIRRAKMRRWNLNEDEILVKAVQAVGQNWQAVAQLVPGRSVRQCRERYLMSLKPSVNVTPFTKDEDTLVMELYREFGRRWEAIARRLVKRHWTQVKNRIMELLAHEEESVRITKSTCRISKEVTEEANEK